MNKLKHPCHGFGPDNPNWRGDDVTYSGAHDRVRSTKGPVNRQVCPCGKQAENWAYDGNDPNELTAPYDGGKPQVYSADPDYYVALCRKCHTREDGFVGVRAANAAAAEKNRAKTHCKWGHEFTKENTYRPPSQPTKRMCRTCLYKRTKDRYAQNS